jgi:adenosylmethionine-8-amino-7-oxononanoate aminotransferase
MERMNRDPVPASGGPAAGSPGATPVAPQGSLQARSLRALWHPCTPMQVHESLPLIALARGEGPWLIDTDGARLLDGISSWWVNLFGHANPRINAAIIDQLQRLEHAMLAGCTHAPAVELSERLAALTGHALGHAFFASDGASAVEIALKMSHHAWRNGGAGQKREFVCVRGGYHGETLGALGVTDVPVFRAAYAELLRPAHVVASPDARAAAPGESAADVARRAAAEVERLFAGHADHIAALVVEPLVQCAAGMAMHDPLYLRELRALCDRYQVHLIADEIAVGFGRTGSFFACEQAGIWPDFLCLSKGISGGYLPLSVVLTREQIYAAFYSEHAERAFLHSHSYTGNPLACRAALAALDIFRDDAVLERNRGSTQHLDALLAPLRGDPRVEHLRRRGMIWAFDVRAGADAPVPPVPFARRYFAAARKHGALLRPIGRTVYLMPPYVLTEQDNAHLARAAIAALDEALEQG